MRYSRREVLGAALALPLAAQHVPGKKPVTRRPNVILFMTDDHGSWATGAYGCPEIQTPHIDRLAREGARFTNAFACTPVCSPSRMTWMTGTLPSTHGVQDWLLPEDSYGPASRRWLAGHQTFPAVLAKAGYAMGMCGKWHMGGDDTAQEGFDYWATVPGGGGTYRNPGFVHNGVRETTPGFKTDRVGDFALDFLSTQTAECPFFLYVPFYAPHTPYDFQPERYREPYRDASFGCFPETPQNPWQNAALKGLHGSRSAKLGYSALVTAADTNMGRILEKLSQMGLADDTVVVFSADQGWNAGHHGVWGKGNGTIPFNLYEESLRVPLIWRHPGHIAAGSTPAPLVSSYDFFPTLLDYLGLKAQPDARRVGRSYAGFLAGKTPAWRNRLYFEYAYVRGIRSETLKYIERAEGWPSEMFDLEADPGETRNVLSAPDYQVRAAAMHRELTQYFEKAGAPPLDAWRKTTAQKLPKEDFVKKGQ